MLPEPWKAVADTFIGGLAYTDWAQADTAPAGYWKDPLRLDEYLEYSCYLAPLNCEIESARNSTLAEHVTNLELLALFGDQSDGVIMPFQSAFFGFYENGTNVVLPLERSELYLNDYIGLAELDRTGRLLQATSGLPHTHYCHGDDGKAFFMNSVVPLLETKKYDSW
ncbi:palmitoyl-protein thioesterase 1 [Kipferlia bialata]|uniref:Palmitoyl-protein thioesterase 1 n=1 Tax=Kipferlia bialata TaxID=797122 RepID=A0A9K3D869_9EUKA|nr:palmitoyl-protein thioesterase 1 [Kipferlia bialata]|eukprot:g11429.t1